MDNTLFLLSGELKTISHILNYSSYIQGVTGDNHFTETLIDIVAEYLCYKSEYCLRASGLAPKENEE